MSVEFSTAARKKSKLRLGIMGAAGAGKTMGALKLASGLAEWDQIFVIDTEHASADLYADLGPYNVGSLSAPFTPFRYVDSIKKAISAGAKVVIIDSLSHAWEGEGGALDMVDKAASSSRSGNSYTAWRDVTPQHRSLVESMLQAPIHIICTLRSKQEYVLEKDERTGKTSPKKIGMAPIQRAGMEYEFTIFMDVNDQHIATASKDRTGLFDGKQFQLTQELGKELNQWLESGEDVAPALAAAPDAEALATVFRDYQTALAAAPDAEALRKTWDLAQKAGLSKDSILRLGTFKDARKFELGLTSTPTAV